MSNRTWGAAIAAYLNALRAAGRSSQTVRLHAHYLRFLRGAAPCPGRVTRQALEHHLARPEWAPETRRSARSVARCFFDYCQDEGIVRVSPAAKLPAVRVPEGVPRPVPESVFRDRLGAVPERTELLIRFAAFCGLRCCEIAVIHELDWDGVALVVHGKGGKRRLVPVLDPFLRAALNEARGWLFPGRKDGHLSAGTVSKLLSALRPQSSVQIVGLTWANIAYPVFITVYLWRCKGDRATIPRKVRGIESERGGNDGWDFPNRFRHSSPSWVHPSTARAVQAVLAG